MNDFFSKNLRPLQDEQDKDDDKIMNSRHEIEYAARFMGYGD